MLSRQTGCFLIICLGALAVLLYGWRSAISGQHDIELEDVQLTYSWTTIQEELVKSESFLQSFCPSDIIKQIKQFVGADVTLYEAQQRAYCAYTKLVRPKVICEIGFDYGHTAYTWLHSALPERPLLYAFGLCTPSTQEKYDKLNQHSPGHVNLVCGVTTTTIPKFQKENPDVKCDLIRVAETHDDSLPLFDMINIAQLAHPRTLLILDNTTCTEIPDCLSAQAAWDYAYMKGLIYSTSCFPDTEKNRGWCQGFVDVRRNHKGLYTQDQFLTWEESWQVRWERWNTSDNPSKFEQEQLYLWDDREKRFSFLMRGLN